MGRKYTKSDRPRKPRKLPPPEDRCEWIRDDGTQCKKPKQNDTKYCNVHPPNKAKSLGKKGAAVTNAKVIEHRALAVRWPVGKSWEEVKGFACAQIGAIIEGKIAIKSEYQRQLVLVAWTKIIVKVLEAQDRAKGIVDGVIVRNYDFPAPIKGVKKNDSLTADV